MIVAISSHIIAAEDPERLLLFGSVARGEAGPDSDIDALVVFSDRIEEWG